MTHRKAQGEQETPRPTRKTPRRATSLVAYAPAPEPEPDDPLLAFAPYLHPCPRGNSITPDKQRKFIATLAIVSTGPLSSGSISRRWNRYTSPPSPPSGISARFVIKDRR